MQRVAAVGTTRQGMSAMKCQQCEKQAVFHITELETGAVRELHLCEDHARVYLNQAEGPRAPPMMPRRLPRLAVGLVNWESARRPTNWRARPKGLRHVWHNLLRVSQPGPAGLSARLRPVCQGTRAADLKYPRATEHTGRKPLRSQQTAAAAEGSAELTGLIGIRREMKEAISREDYEKAKENRDAIRAIEDRWIPPPARNDRSHEPPPGLPA